MIGTSFGEYVFIRICIFLLRTIAPLSLLYCLLFLAVRPGKLEKYRLPIALEIWLLSESLFYVLLYLPLRTYLQRGTTHPHLGSRSERQTLFKRCLDHTTNLEDYVRGWFLNAPLQEIKKENIKEFLAWALLNERLETITEEEDEELEQRIHDLEAVLDWEIEPGRGKANSIRLSFDSVSMRHRPLLWYLIVGIVDCFSSVRLLWAGYHFYRLSLRDFFTNFPFRPLALASRNISAARTISYWHRPHKSKTRLPIVFVHGIGIGHHPYVDFLIELTAQDPLRHDDGEVGIIAVEIMHVSARLCAPAISCEEMREEIKKIVKHHGWVEFVLVSNSYGTAVSANLFRDDELRRYMKAAVFVDPVCFLLSLPDVAYNFTRRPPKHANEHQLYYFASMDMMTSHTLSRHFYWSEYVLWKEDIAHIPTTVVLAGKDLIVNTDAVWKYLAGSNHGPRDSSRLENDNHIQNANLDSAIGESPNEDGPRQGERPLEWKDGNRLEVLWFKELDHSSVFDTKGPRRSLEIAVRRHCLRSNDQDSLS